MIFWFLRFASKCNLYRYAEVEQLSCALRELLQRKVEVCGVKVVSFELSDLSYAAEVGTPASVTQYVRTTGVEAKLIEAKLIEAPPRQFQAAIRDRRHQPNRSSNC